MRDCQHARKTVLILLSLVVVLVAAAIVPAAPPAVGASVSDLSDAEKREQQPIVNTNVTYTYAMMERDLFRLAARYPDVITYTIIGKTEYNRNLYAVKLGSGSASVLINASHHAREWISTVLVMKMIETYAQASAENEPFLGYDVRNLLKDVSLWFVPMVNPDGVTLQQSGLAAFPREKWDKLLRMNGGSDDFTRWKANASGIDLNRQYPADWENIRANSPYPTYHNYKGTSPLETHEAKAMAAFTYETDPEIAVAYHSSGEILYWHFHNKSEHIDRDYALARQLSAMTGYRLVDPTPNPSGGGYTDWFIQEFGRPGFTPELGKYIEERHVPLSAFPKIWEQNREVGLFLAAEAYRLHMERIPPCDCSETLQLFRETPLYAAPSHRAEQAATAGAVILTGKKKHADWYLVEWSAEAAETGISAENAEAAENRGKGEYWVNEREVRIGASAPIDQQLTLFEQTALYDAPVANRTKQGSVSPQTVHAVQKHGDWYQIKTWAGDKWIRPQRFQIGEIDTKRRTIELTEEAQLYDLPFPDAPGFGRISPQTVAAVQRIGDWYNIRTWLGDKWIFVPAAAEPAD